MIQNIFDFSDTSVEEIMTHRTEISSINMRSTRKQIIEYVQNERFTRFPVYDKGYRSHYWNDSCERFA